MRLFTAVVLPGRVSGHLDSALGGVGGALVSDPGAGLRWTPRSQRHITLAFHGNVPDGSVAIYVDTLGALIGEYGVEPFDVALAGSGTFMSRVLWAGVGQGAERIRKVAGIVELAAAEAGFRADHRAGGRPHVTLARVSSNRGDANLRSGRRRSGRSRHGNRSVNSLPDGAASGLTGFSLDAWAHALSIYRGPTWAVNAISVVKSELGQGQGGGPQHTELAQIPLGAIGAIIGPHSWERAQVTAGPHAATSAGAQLNYPLKHDLVDAW